MATLHENTHISTKRSLFPTRGEASPPMAVWCSCGSSWTWIRPTRTRTGTRRRLRTMATTGQLVTTRSLPSMGWPAISSRRNCARGMCTRPARPGGAWLPPRVCRHQPRGVRAGGMGIPNLPAVGDDGELYQGGKARLLPGQDGQLRLPREPGPHDGKPLGLQYRQLPAYPVPFQPGRQDRESERSWNLFCIQPVLREKNEKLAQWSGLSTSFLSYAGQQKKDYPQVRFSPTLEKVLSFFTSFKCPRLSVRNGRVESPSIGPPLR